MKSLARFFTALGLALGLALAGVPAEAQQAPPLKPASPAAAAAAKEILAMKNASAMYASDVPNIVQQTKDQLMQRHINHQKDVDLFVIGGGSGGVRAARIAAGHGARVMIAEEYRMGGTCVIRGCVPKKLLVYASHIHHEIEDAAGFGWTIPPATFDWPTLIANKDKEIARLEAAYTANVEKSGARIVKTRAVFEDAHSLRLGTGETIKSNYVLIATGGAPNPGAAIPGIEHVISSNEVFHLKSLPKRILIQGGGYIALEFACIFAGFGCDVTLVYRGENILRGFDDEVRAHLRGEMEKLGIRILTGCTVHAVDKHGNEFTSHLSNGSSIASDQVMFAIGRHPNVANLGLEKADVAINPRNGGIAVDNFSRTSVPNIYAIGDVTHRLNLT